MTKAERWIGLICLGVIFIPTVGRTIDPLVSFFIPEHSGEPLDAVHSIIFVLLSLGVLSGAIRFLAELIDEAMDQKIESAIDVTMKQQIVPAIDSRIEWSREEHNYS
jgi:hypothetical protein